MSAWPLSLSRALRLGARACTQRGAVWLSCTTAARSATRLPARRHWALRLRARPPILLGDGFYSLCSFACRLFSPALAVFASADGLTLLNCRGLPLCRAAERRLESLFFARETPAVSIKRAHVFESCESEKRLFPPPASSRHPPLARRDPRNRQRTVYVPENCAPAPHAHPRSNRGRNAVFRLRRRAHRLRIARKRVSVLLAPRRNRPAR